MQGRDVPECTAGHHGLVHQNEKSTLGDISVNAGTADLLEFWVLSFWIPVSINLLLPGRIYGHRAKPSWSTTRTIQLTATRANPLDYHNDTLAWLAANCEEYEANK